MKYSFLKNHKNSPYSHDKNHNGIQPALKTLRKQSWLPSNAPRESDYSTYFALLNCRIFSKKFASLIWQNFLQAIRFAHLAKEVTFKGQFCIFRFAQHLQNHFKCSLCSLFTNKFVYAHNACAQIRPLPWFFRLPNFVLLQAFIAGWMPLYLKF